MEALNQATPATGPLSALEVPAPSRTEAGAEVEGKNTREVAVPSPVNGTAAFAAFMAPAQNHGRRRLTAVGLAVALHAAGLIAFVVNDFMHVDELAAPAVKLSFLSLPTIYSAPPLPAPPPPAKSDAQPAAKRPERRDSVVEKTAEAEPIVQPAPEPVAEAPEPVASASDAAGGETSTTEDGEAGSAAGDVNGVAGAPTGAANGVAVAPPPAPQPPALDANQRRMLLDRYLREIMGKRIDGNRFYPPEAEEAGLEATVIVRVVVDAAGRLLSASVLRGDDVPVLARAALHTIRKSQPFPPPPSALGGQVQVDVTLDYQIQL